MSEQQPNINKEQSVASCCPDETGSDPRANTQTRPHTELSGKVFRIFAYNDPDAENQYQKIIRDARALDSDSSLVTAIETSAMQGRQTADLLKELEQRFKNRSGTHEATVWLEGISDTLASPVVEQLRKNLNKKINYLKSKEILGAKNTNFRISLEHPGLKDGLHPNNLRSLSPSEQWEIYIDETGKEFTEHAQSLNESDITLGRLVAIVMPKNHQLPSLRTHGIDLSYSEIEQILQTLIETKVGIFGATLKSDLQSHSWIAAVSKFVRWVLLMLPMNGGSLVIFKIENRLSYTNSAKLKALEETILDELKELAPERFENLQLSLEIVTKTAPYNGYVDVVANCWGSSDPMKRKLLTQARLLGHCLLQSSDSADIDRIYLKSNVNLDTGHWFNICENLAKEPGHSLFHDLLMEQGERAKLDPGLWKKYLSEARQRITLKKFDAGSLRRALSWLKEYKPSSEKLPNLLELQLESAQLAAENHLGQSNFQRVASTLTLATELMEESAQDACEAVLRVAISATNGFDFSSAVPFIEHWVSEPVAVKGLLNHGKLISTLGQLSALPRRTQPSDTLFQ